jgi:hypothetical protein
MQFALGKAEAWAGRVGLKVSAAKSKAMIFSTEKTAQTLSTPLLLDGHEIELVEEFKYLGVLVDRKLSWMPHILHKVKKAKRHLMMLHRGIGTIWGPTPAITLWLYNGVVETALTYGAAVWARRTTTITAIRKLNTVQRLGMMMVAPMRLKKPTAGLEIMLGVPPLAMHIQQLAVNTSNRLNLTPLGWTGKSRSKLGHIAW